MKRILQSSAIIGMGSLVGIVAGVGKAKAVALWLGPEGIGFLGLLQAAMMIGTVLVGIGLPSAGIRDVSSARNDEDEEGLSTTAATLFRYTFLCSVGFVAIAMGFHEEIQATFLGEQSNTLVYGTLAVGVIAGAYANVFNAFVTGFRDVSAQAIIRIFSAVVGVTVGLGAVFALGMDGIAVLVAAAPVTTVLAAVYFYRRLAVKRLKATWSQVNAKAKNLIGLGSAMMLTALMETGVQFVIRWMLDAELGRSPLGQFQAAWSISMLYLSFVLGAMAADYYPSLAETKDDHTQLNKQVNEQTHVAGLLTAPLILGLFVAAPLVILILYSSEFTDTVSVLRWQLLGDLFKVPAWALAFVLMVKNHNRLYLSVQIIWNALYLTLVYFGMSTYGVEITGIAFLIAYAVIFFYLLVVLRKVTNFRFSRQNLVLTGVVLLALVAIGALFAVPYYYVPQILVVVGVGLFCLREIQKGLGEEGWRGLLKRK